MNENISTAPRIVMIGGGTGSFALLSSLKNYVQDITALVNMVDSGGSTGVLRDELGTLPAGDVRQCLVALSRSSDTMRELFTYRFPEGTFEGHSFGNLFITAVEKITDNFASGVELAGDVLNIQGRVLPMTLDNISLVYEKEDGSKIIGEDQIGKLSFDKEHLPNFSLKPAAGINPEAKAAILEADMVVIAPGNLYRSIVPALIVDGVADAIRQTKAKVVYVSNLVVDELTSGLSVDGLVKEIERFIGSSTIDYVLYNIKDPEPEQLEKYAKKHFVPIDYNQKETAMAHYKAIGKDLLSRRLHKQDKNDTFISRTLIRHDGETVSKELMKIFYS